MTNVVKPTPRTEREETNEEALRRIDGALEMLLQGHRPEPASVLQLPRRD